MGLLAPAGLAALLLLGPLLILHMLRRERRPQPVSSLMLWRALLREAPSDRPWQRPPLSPLLLLQILILVALAFALARPWLRADVPAGEAWIVLLDRTASMAARDESPTRLEAAKRRLLDLSAAAPERRLTLIVFDDSMEIPLAESRDPAALRRALEGIVPRLVAGDATDAIRFAASLAQARPEAEILLLSDGVSVQDRQALEGLPLRWERFGEDSDNQAITALELVPGDAGLGRPDQAFVQVASRSTGRSSRNLSLLADGRLIDARQVDLPAGGRSSYSLNLPDGSRSLEARLSGEDLLPLDDRAWAVAPAAARHRLLLLSDGNRFLESALSLLPSVASLSSRLPTEAGMPLGAVDALILDGLGPERLPAASARPMLIIAPSEAFALEEPWAIESIGRLAWPRPVTALPDHPLAKGLALGELALSESAALRLGPAWQPILVTELEGQRWPLLAEGRIAGQPALLLAFDLRASDLPLRPAFPLLMAAAVERLLPDGPAGLAPALPAGQPLALRIGAAYETAEIWTREGERIALRVEAGLARSDDPLPPGLHRLEMRGEGLEDRDMSLAVNAGAAEAYRIRPRELLSSEVEPTAAADIAAAPIERDGGRRELWREMTGLALLLLAAESLYAHRLRWWPWLAPAWNRAADWAGRAGGRAA